MSRRYPLLALWTGVALIGCENDPSVGVEGTYRLNVSIPVDECTGQPSSFSSEVTIEREGDDVTFRFGDAAVLTGTIDNDTRIMTVDGTILVDLPPPGTGTFPGFMQMEARVTEGELNAVGSIVFEGTFPGVSGTCTQQFLAQGPRLGLSPLPLTGP